MNDESLFNDELLTINDESLFNDERLTINDERSSGSQEDKLLDLFCGEEGEGVERMVASWPWKRPPRISTRSPSFSFSSPMGATS